MSHTPKIAVIVGACARSPSSWGRTREADTRRLHFEVLEIGDRPLYNRTTTQTRHRP